MSWASICFIVSTTTDTTMSRLVPPRPRVARSGIASAMTDGETATMARNSAPANVMRVTTRAR